MSNDQVSQLAGELRSIEALDAVVTGLHEQRGVLQPPRHGSADHRLDLVDRCVSVVAAFLSHIFSSGVVLDLNADLPEVAPEYASNHTARSLIVHPDAPGRGSRQSVGRGDRLAHESSDRDLVDVGAPTTRHIMTSIPIFYGFRSEGGRLASGPDRSHTFKHRHPASAGPDGGVDAEPHPNTAPQPSTPTPIGMSIAAASRGRPAGSGADPAHILMGARWLDASRTTRERVRIGAGIYVVAGASMCPSWIMRVSWS